MSPTFGSAVIRRRQLARLGVEHFVVPLPPHPRLEALLALPALDDPERDELLALASQIAKPWGYRYPACDLVVLAPGQPGLDEQLANSPARTSMQTTRCVSSSTARACSASSRATRRSRC